MSPSAFRPCPPAGFPTQMAALRRGLSLYGVDSLPEVADGDAPHAPNGCPAQAWSVAEVLRAYVVFQDSS